MKLRPYQQTAIDRLYDHLRRRDDNPCIVIPTGGGKTPIIAQIVKDAVERWNGRICILAHRKELLEQNAKHITQFSAKETPIGIYSAGLKRKDVNAPVIVAGIQSIFRKATEVGSFNLILIDEAHRIPPDGEGMYRQFLNEAKVVNPTVRLIGFTATPYRMNSGYICGPDNLLNEICYEASVRELIVDGYLCGLVSKAGKPESIADTSGVHTRGGEFIGGELEDAMADEAVVSSAAQEIIHYTQERNKCLIFTCGIEHGTMVQEKLSRLTEYKVEFVHSETPAMLRAFALKDFKDLESDLKYLVNVNVLTEGFDAPNIDTIVLLRATQSPGLYYQMCGRGFRIDPSKKNALVLDYGENIFRHGPVDAIRPTAGSDGDNVPPMKACPECHNVDYAGVKHCTQCGYEYQFEEPSRGKHTRTSSDEGILSDQIERRWCEVTNIEYREHTKRGADENHPRTLRVDYRTGFGTFVSEWICVEHDPGSYPRAKAELWWFRRTGMDFPGSAREAVEIADGKLLREPTCIEVMTKSGDKFETICGARFSDDEIPEELKDSVTVIAEEDIPF